MNHSENDITIEQIVDSFSARLENGERPTIEGYKQKYPHLAERIEAVLPALMALEEIDSQPVDRKLAVDDSIPEILGDYQIIQEVGRGGMGIVFEAQHSTMRRRVALKVLPKSSAEKPNFLNRFLTEARSAGQLHHTNIVPVFEVGEAEGIHFYAMQFIHGDNLDRVIEDIRLLRENSNADSRNEASQKPYLSKNNGKSDLRQSVALGMVRGDSQVEATTERVPREKQERRLEITEHRSKDTATAPSNSTTHPIEGRKAGLSDTILGASKTSTIMRTRNVYHQRVAAVGVQVAQALEYAHNHNVLHRDVKPANLILDTDGNVWVTDFGLAKLESNDLTQTGDIIGTLRYMAPERFEGKADRRSDIYGVGLTLYELCTLKCAFENDRGTLFKDVTNSSSVVGPRKLDETIPADLETIILKAIEAQPEQRYQSARELAEDLQLFLSDRPIKARRASFFEKSWRVCRRNPIASGLLGCVATLLVALTIGSLQFAFYKANQTNAEIKLREKLQASLYDAKFDQARLRRYSQRIGQRYETLANIDQAVQLLSDIELSESERGKTMLSLRNEAVAALALTDMRTRWEIPLADGWGRRQSIAMNSNYTICAQGHHDGRIRILKFGGLHENREEMILPSPGSPTWVMKFSPDGRFLAAANNKENALYRDVELNVWDLESPRQPIFKKQGVVSFDFSDNDQLLSFAFGNRVEILSLVDAEVMVSLTPGFNPRVVKLSDDSMQVAVSQRGGEKIEIWNIGEDPDLEWSHEIDDQITAMDWHSSRNLLAVGTRSGGVYFWHGGLDAPPAFSEVHQNVVKRLHIHPYRDLLITGALDLTVRLTNLITGHQSLRVDDRAYLLDSGFSEKGDICYTDFRNRTFGVWEVAKPVVNVFSKSQAVVSVVCFHPTSSRIVARMTDQGIEFWDVVNGKLLHRFESKSNADFCFSKHGKFLFTSGNSGVRKWQFDFIESDGSIEIELGQPITLIENSTNWMTISASGKTIVAGNGFNPIAVDANDGSIKTHFGRHGGLRSLSISANEKWLVTGTQLGLGVGVWNMQTGELVKMLMPNLSNVTGSTHPIDKNQFITNSGQIRRWQFDDWNNSNGLYQPAFSNAIARYSEDGNMLAIKNRTNSLVVLNTAIDSELLTFQTIDDSRLVDYRFSVDGTRLAMSCFDDLQILDIARLRSELERLGLDWQ